MSEIVSLAVEKGVDLRGAKLRGADLSDCDLTWVNFTRAKLRGANLIGADLGGAIGNMKEIMSIKCGRYSVVWTDNVLQIGWEQHPISEWKNFSDKDISRMDSGALEWWKKWKDYIFLGIDLAKETK